MQTLLAASLLTALVLVPTAAGADDFVPFVIPADVNPASEIACAQRATSFAVGRSFSMKKDFLLSSRSKNAAALAITSECVRPTTARASWSKPLASKASSFGVRRTNGQNSRVPGRLSTIL